MFSDHISTLSIKNILFSLNLMLQNLNNKLSLPMCILPVGLSVMLQEKYLYRYIWWLQNSFFSPFFKSSMFAHIYTLCVWLQTAWQLLDLTFLFIFLLKLPGMGHVNFMIVKYFLTNFAFFACFWPESFSIFILRWNSILLDLKTSWSRCRN